MCPPQAPTGAHLPPSSTPLRPLVCAVQECKYASRALMPLQVCHCAVGGVAASLCNPYLPICPSTKPPYSLINHHAHPHHYVWLFNTEPNIIREPPSANIVSEYMSPRRGWSGGQVWLLVVKRHTCRPGPSPQSLMPHRHSTRAKTSNLRLCF